MADSHPLPPPPAVPGAGSPFDERSATVNAALGLWCGLAGGVVVALGGFDDPRLIENAWVRLMTLGATAVALGWALQTPLLGLARRLQLGVAVSLLLHTVLIVGLSQAELRLAEDPYSEAASEPQAMVESEKPSAIVAVSRNSPSGQSEFDRPVPSETPTLDAAQASIEQSPPQALQMALEKPAEALAILEQSLPQAETPAAPMPSIVDASLADPSDSRRPVAPIGASPLQQPESLAARATAATPPVSLPAAAPVESPLRQPLASLPSKIEIPRAELEQALSATDRQVSQSPPPVTMVTDTLEPFTPAATPNMSTPDMSIAVELPPLAAVPNNALPDDRPQPLVLDRPQRGFAGLQESRNANAQQRAVLEFPDALAAGAASDRETTQRVFGEAQSPSLDQQRPSPTARDDDTALTRKASDTNAAEVAGARQPEAVRRSALAGDRDASSDDRLANKTTVLGQEELNVRAPQIVPEIGQQRGSSGGLRGFGVDQSRRALLSRPLSALPHTAAPRVASAAQLSSAGRSAAPPLSSTVSPPANPRGLVAISRGGPRGSGALSPPLRLRADAPSPVPSTAPSPVLTRGVPPAPRLAMRDSPAVPSIGLPAPARLENSPTTTTPPESLVDVASKSLPLPTNLLPGRSQRRTAPAFSKRAEQHDDPQIAGQPSTKTEAAIELGLRFLADAQLEEGRWSFASLGEVEVPAAEAPNLQADAAATGLALLAMLGAGYDHFDGPYQEPIQRALDYLVSVQQSSGLLFPEDDSATGAAASWQVARFYSHGIAAIALCEAYGMTGDARLRQPAQRALDYIAQTQVRRLGGWRYTPGTNADLSVTGWQLMALKSGELAGLEVRQETYFGIAQFLEACRERAGERARFCYNPSAPVDDPRTSHGRQPGTVMTSVGLLVQMYLGEDPTSQRSLAGAGHLLNHLPTLGEPAADGRWPAARNSTLGNPLRDTYYWYYATQVMFHTGGQHWSAWSDALRPLLLESQETAGPLAGSWDPLRPTPDKWSPFGGRLYVTTMNLLSLEVAYRHLPLYTRMRLAEGEATER